MLKSLRSVLAASVANLLGACLLTASAGATNYEVVYRFKGGSDGFAPVAGPTRVGNVLYGTTSVGGGSGCFSAGCGTVFKVTPSGSETVLYRFTGGSDGQYPIGRLLSAANALYGTTAYGGAFDDGTVFRITADGVEEVIHSFRYDVDGGGPTSSLEYYNGVLYGDTSSSAFRMTLRGVVQNIATLKGSGDLNYPAGNMLDILGVLYGTTGTGGNDCLFLDTGTCGTVFTLPPSGSATVLHSFSGIDGAFPSGNIAHIGTTIYGTSQWGGKHNLGAVYSITTTGVEKVVYSFRGIGDGPKKAGDGANPIGGIIVYNGELYGTTGSGGTFNLGTVFKLTRKGVETVLYSFKGGSDGAYPEGTLLNVNGMLYGTTSKGGYGGITCEQNDGCGTVFKITP